MATRSTTDASGNVISRTRYEPYGYVASGTQPTIGFTGHVNDTDTGLTYMQQRYYDPVAGRFMSVDPVTADANTGGGFNRFSYANNNPYKYVDPDGRFGIPGAIVDAGLEIGLQLALDKSVNNWTAVGVAAAAGMVTGGLKYSPKNKCVFGFHNRRAAALAPACSARTAAHSPPCIASGSVRQNSHLFPVEYLGGIIEKAAVRGMVTSGRAVAAAAAVGGQLVVLVKL